MSRAAPHLHVVRDLDTRLPPHAPDAEAALIGAVLFDPAALDLVADLVQPEEFYLGSHRLVFTTALSLRARGLVVDPVTVGTELRSQGRLGEIEGGLRGLTELMLAPAAVTPTALRSYARSVLDLGRLRRVIATAQRIASDAYAASLEGIDEWLAERVETLRTAAEGRVSDADKSNNDVLRDLVEEMKRRATGVDVGVPTGIVELDNMLGGGLQLGDVVIVAARPRVGKTAFASGVCTHAARSGVASRLFSLEQRRDALMRRSIAGETGIEYTKIQSGNLSWQDWSAFTRASVELAKLPFIVEHPRGGTTMAQIRARVMRLKRETPTLGLVAIDYAQIITPRREDQNGKTPRPEQVANISRAMKPLAEEANVALLLLAQTNRDNEDRGKNKRHILSDLGESGQLERDADVVAFLYRDSLYNRDAKVDEAELHVLKHKNGGTGMIKLSFCPERMSFGNYLGGHGDWRPE